MANELNQDESLAGQNLSFMCGLSGSSDALEPMEGGQLLSKASSLSNLTHSLVGIFSPAPVTDIEGYSSRPKVVINDIQRLQRCDLLVEKIDSA